MAKKLVQNITAREEDFAQWYTDVVREAKLCDYSGVKGCMNYLPNGYALWENIQKELDARFKETGVENVYLPVMIPESLLQKEKDHIEGFAPEVAWVTHLRHCSAMCGARQYSLIVICQKYGISGVLFCVGRRRQDRSCVPENFYGRKDIRSMPHMKRQKSVQSRCGESTETSYRMSWQSR